MSIERSEKPAIAAPPDDRTVAESPAGSAYFESLYRALDTAHADDEIRAIVGHLAGMGFPYKYLLWQVRRKVGLKASIRLRRVLHDLGIRD